MKLLTSTTEAARRTESRRLLPLARPGESAAAFTLVEIALCLAIVGFAMVAIIGVLPAGMRVQKDNREETIINQDGLYLLEAIRSGSRGIDDLTNFVDSITISNTVYRNNAIVGRSVRIYTNDVKAPLATRLVGGADIVGLLSTPKIRVLPNGTVQSNTITAFVRSITGVAAEKSSQASVKEFAFRYLLRSEVIPFTQPPLASTNEALRSIDLANNLYDVRLTLNWPLFERGGKWEVGSDRKSFRTLVAGEVMTDLPGAKPNTFFFEPRSYVSR